MTSTSEIAKPMMGDATDRTAEQRQKLRTDAKAPARSRYLFSPIFDFLCLGGGSLFVLGIIALLVPPSSTAIVAVTMMVLAHFVNNPHFAHSYQIFYGGFATKAFSWTTPPALRVRYILAGIIVPLALVTFFATTILRGHVVMLGFGINLMGFLVGWHYVKQGYGMIIVDAVLKKNYFSDQEKQVLSLNAYAVWIMSWLYVNHTIHQQNFFGLKGFVFDVPTAMLMMVAVIAALTGLVTFLVILRKGRDRRHVFPWAGTAAYIAALYVWLLAGRINPMLLLVIPFFHSLQYMIVVWRFQLNRERAEQDGSPAGTKAKHRAWDTPGLRLALFSLLGVLFGYLGFWFLPQSLDRTVDYDRSLFGASLFMFLFWIFINVHHYFLDNVMWRRENPAIGKYLFAAR
jgi:hypothetical protein